MYVAVVTDYINDIILLSLTEPNWYGWHWI